MVTCMKKIHECGTFTLGTQYSQWVLCLFFLSIFCVCLHYSWVILIGVSRLSFLTLVFRLLFHPQG